ncbi:MAG: hypothetical protein M1817_005008 [Caeruleum heppii]|nr:MAG: hypothetical protein M1817_005008 [Caeruleum heppii]
MAQTRKYEALPDLDSAPDIYETPDLADNVSTLATSTTARSASPSSTHSSSDDQEHISRHRLRPSEARSQFSPARVSARDVDFSDRISSKRKSYRVSLRRTRRGHHDHDDELGDFSDEDEDGDEGVERKMARLRREVMEVQEEVQRRKAEREKMKLEGGEEVTREGSEDKEEQGIAELCQAVEDLRRSESKSGGNASTELIKMLGSSIKATEQTAPPGALGSTTAPTAQSDTVSPSYTINYAPSYSSDHTLAKAASFDARLTFIETALGLPPGPSALSPSPLVIDNKPILPTLDTLTRQLSLLSTATPASLDQISRRVRQLSQDAEKLAEARTKARLAKTEQPRTEEVYLPYSGTTVTKTLSAEESTSRPAPPMRTPTERDPTEPAPDNDNEEDDEKTTRVNALYALLPTIEALHPLLPPLLDRLKSLRHIHEGAASARSDLEAVADAQREMSQDIREWREALGEVQRKVLEGEEVLRRNVEGVEGWIERVEGRVEGLRREGGDRRS